MSRWRMLVTAHGCCLPQTFCSKICVTQKGPVSPPTPAFGSHCPSFPHRAHMAPSHSSCEWHSDFPTVWILRILAAGALVPSIYFYIYVLSCQLSASFPGREGRVCGKVQAHSRGDHLGSHGGKGRDCCCYSCSRLPSEGRCWRASREFWSTQSQLCQQLVM